MNLTFLTILKCSVDLNFEFNVTVGSCMNNNFCVVDFYSLVQFTRLNIFKALASEGNFLLKVSYVFLNNVHEKRLKYLLMVFVFIQSYLSSPSLGRMCTKVKACNQVKFFTPEYISSCDALNNIHYNYQFKIFTISNIKRLNNILSSNTASTLR